MKLFQDQTPDRYLWVSPDGSDLNDGSRDEPFGSIQAAADAATPGTAVIVEGGDYHENVKIRSSGTESAPIWIVAANDEQPATIIPLSETLSTVYGRGVDNVVLSGFHIDGADGQHAIEFTQAGRDYHNFVNNVVIQNNHIFGTGLDGIKLAQARNVEVVGNKIFGGREESIDLVTVSDAIIAANEIIGLDGRSGITAKGGSERIHITKNSIQDVGADGITIGGWTDQSLLSVLSLEFQAKDVIVEDNLIQGVEKRAINILGGQDTRIEGNYLDPDNDYSSAVNIQEGRWGLPAKNVVIENNIIAREDWLQVNSGQGEGLSVKNNRQSGEWEQDVGLAAADNLVFSWLSTPSSPSSPILPSSSSEVIATWQIDRVFDGVDDRHIIDHAADWALSSGTISFRFTPGDVEGTQGLLSKDAKYFGDGGHFSLWLEEDQVVARLQGEDTSYTLRSEPGSVAANAESHIAVTFGEGGFKLYVDGQLADMNAYDGGIEGNLEPIVAGGRAIYSNSESADIVTDLFRGTIGDVSVYDTALDAEAIDDLSSQTTPPAPSSPSSPILPSSSSEVIATWQIDRVFDGVDDRHIIDHAADWALSSGTISFRFTPGDVEAIQGLLSKDAKYFGDGGHFSLWLEEDQVVARLQGEDTSYTLRSEPGSVAANAESHIAVTFGEGGFKLYVDGQLADMNAYDGGIEGNLEPIVAGGRAIYSNSESADIVTDLFRGTIGDVSVYDTALDAEAIDDLSSQTTPPAPSSPSSPILPSSSSEVIATWQIDRVFDGVDDHHVIQDSDELRIADGAIKVAFTPQDTLGMQGLVSKDAKYFGEGGHFTMYLQGEKLVARLQDREASYTVESGQGAIEVGKQSIATVEFGRDGMRLLIDGELVDKNNHMGGLEMNGEDIILGASAIYSSDGENNRLTQFFKGRIDEITLQDHDLDTDLAATLSESLFSNSNFDTFDT